ncbi:MULTISPECIES: phage antirepressor KilAC domain-containing protein [unclassified Bartonella]|uniref:phage antirepressor KilAC domain-containing protein n=1 Tax=unclassified Bartonella TaxID=2645622 RepID=UPI0035D03E03
MNNSTYSPTNKDKLIKLREVENEPRVRDVDLAEKLGFVRTRDVRKLITRNMQEIERFGRCATVAHVIKGNNVTEYWLNEEQALLIATLSNTEKSSQVRYMLIKLFVAWRRGEIKQSYVQSIDYSSPAVMLGVLTHLKDENERKDNIIAKLEPKAKALDGLKRSDGLFGLIEAAKMLEVRPKDLTNYLRKNDWVYRRAPGAPLLPYQDKIKKGFMDCPAITIQRPDGTEKVLPSTKITSRGLACLREQIHGGVQ